MSSTPLIESPDDWFRRSRRCAFEAEHRGCVTAAYQDRVLVLAGIGAPASPSGRCQLADRTTAMISDTANGGALLLDGRVVAIGSTATPAWQPFLTCRRRGNKAEFRNLDGKSLATCRFTKKKEQR